ncbi:MAG TPA: FtsQ-type POTRA domain-containing protein [Gemmatimonadales bacterium]|nr:FtsQ-type POTRA domain-containing protein [Gemmatimonadales bacterium]
MPRVSPRALAWVGAAMLLVAMWMMAPLALRRLRFFRVRQVEIVGVRYLDVGQVLAALHLPARASVFDDTNILVERLRRLDGVADASVSRRPPASLRVIVREIEPVALLRDARGTLAVVDADARPLPFDPAKEALDRPIVWTARRAGVAGARAGAGAGAAEAATTSDSSVLGLLARVQVADPAFFQMIDAARGTGSPRGDVVLELGAHRVLFSRDAGPEVIEAVLLVARDLAARARTYAELDARFAGQVVVRRTATGGI